MTTVKVHRRNQIGGTVTVITAEKEEETRRILIDYGKNIPGMEGKEFQYSWEEEPVDAVFFTHYHQDHVGRILEIPEQIPIYMGEAARRILQNIHKYLSHRKGPEGKIHQKIYELLLDGTRVHTFSYDRKKRCFSPIKEIPLFTVEPYSIDHSAYDSYMYLIEAEDETKENGKKVILHTGDFRDHGRRGRAVKGIIDHYIHGKQRKREVDILVIEGTMMTRQTEQVKTEWELGQEARVYMKKHSKVFLICSSTNLDSLAGFYQAWQQVCFPKKGYFYTYSSYCREQLKAFSETAGQFSEGYRFENVYSLDLEKRLKRKRKGASKSGKSRVDSGSFITQKELMDQHGFLAVIKPEFFCEKYIDAFLEGEEKLVIIYSLWEGYLNPKKKAYRREWDEFLQKQRQKGIQIKYLHTSGHATAKTIAEVIRAVNPREEIIPMHTEGSEEFLNLEIGEELRRKIKR